MLENKVLGVTKIARHAGISIGPKVVFLFFVISCGAPPAFEVKLSSSSVAEDVFSAQALTGDGNGNLLTPGPDKHFGSLEMNPRDTEDSPLEGARITIADDDAIYVAGRGDDHVGFAGDGRWLVQKFFKVDGSAFAGFSTITINPLDAGQDNEDITAMRLCGDELLIAGIDANNGGQWRVVKRSAVSGLSISEFGENGSLILNFSPGTDHVTSLFCDGTNLYIAGFDNSHGGTDTQWRVELRSLSNGLPIDSFGENGVLTINHSNGDDRITKIAVLNGQLLLAGYDSAVGNKAWRFEVRNAMTGSKDTILFENP